VNGWCERGASSLARVGCVEGLDGSAGGDCAAACCTEGAERVLALVTGGLPIICARWRHGKDTRSFLARELANPVSPLVVSAQLSLAAEFPDQAQARMVLAAIGSGERTFTNIARAAGGVGHSTLSHAADLLISKGVVAGELPVSLSPSKERRYRITDSYLRFWLAFLGPHLAEVDRMRSDLTLARIERSWTD